MSDDPTKEPEYISKDEALEAVRGAAWTQPAAEEDATCGHPGCTDHPGQGRQRIHTFLGPIGADWDLVEAEEYIASAQRCAWVWHPIGHELGVIGDDSRAIYFEVRRPVVAAAGLVGAEPAGNPHDGDPSHGGGG